MKKERFQELTIMYLHSWFSKDVERVKICSKKELNQNKDSFGSIHAIFSGYLLGTLVGAVTEGFLNETPLQKKVESFLCDNDILLNKADINGLICTKIFFDKKITKKDCKKFFTSEGKFYKDTIPKKEYKKLLKGIKDKNEFLQKIYQNDIESGYKNSIIGIMESELGNIETQEITDFSFLFFKRIILK
jgi:hypothetical protein